MLSQLDRTRLLFYQKLTFSLVVTWLLFTVFSFLVFEEHYSAIYWLLPPLTFAACAKWFVIVWFARSDAFKRLFCDKRTLRPLSPTTR